MLLHLFADVFALPICREERNKFRPYTDFADSYILCKDIANEDKESLFSICRVQLYLMQRYCQRGQRKFTFNLSSAAISYAKLRESLELAKLWGVFSIFFVCFRILSGGERQQKSPTIVELFCFVGCMNCCLQAT